MEQPELEIKKIKSRNIIECNPQLELFEKGSPREKSPRVSRHENRVFKNREPRSIRFNNIWLDEYLNKVGIKEPFVVRELLEKQNWSEFEKRYGLFGCAAYAPLAMTGLILYGLMQGIETLRGLERLARTDVACMWVAGGITPDHASIGRFIVLQGDLLSGNFFESLTMAVLNKTGSGASSVAGDGTVIQAVASRHKTIKREAAEAVAKQTAEAAQGSDDEILQAKAEHAQEVLEMIQERVESRNAKGRDGGQVQINPHEPEAVVQPLKEGGYAPSYKPSVLANEDRIIVAYEVDPSNESRVVASMVEMAQRIGGEKVNELMMDSGYFNNEIITECIEQNINLLCPEGRSLGSGEWTKQSKLFGKSAFSYDEEHDIYRCPEGHAMQAVDRYAGTEKNPGYVRYGTAACSGCPKRDLCTKDKEGRRIKRYAGDDAKDALRQVMKDPRARWRYRKRQAIVEPVFGYIKRVLKLTRFRRRGLGKVRIEFALYALAYNLCRCVDRLKAVLIAAFCAFIYVLLVIDRAIKSPHRRLMIRGPFQVIFNIIAYEIHQNPLPYFATASVGRGYLNPPAAYSK